MSSLYRTPPPRDKCLCASDTCILLKLSVWELVDVCRWFSFRHWGPKTTQPGVMRQANPALYALPPTVLQGWVRVPQAHWLHPTRVHVVPAPPLDVVCCLLAPAGACLSRPQAPCGKGFLWHPFPRTHLAHWQPSAPRWWQQMPRGTVVPET